MKPLKVNHLEILAQNMVGDGKSPNLFFVSLGGTILTITRSWDTAYSHWKSLVSQYPTQESMLEDRRFGVICSVEPKSENVIKGLIVIDDSRSFLKMYPKTTKK